MHRAHLRPAKGRTAQSGLVNHLPGLQLMRVIGPPGAGKPGGIAEGGPGRAVFRRLAGIALGDLVEHARLKRCRVAFGGVESGRHNHPAFRQNRRPIGQLQISRGNLFDQALPGDNPHADQMIGHI